MGNLAAVILVAVLVNVQSVQLDCDGGFSIQELEGGKTFEFNVPLKIFDEGNVFRLPARVKSLEKDKFLTVNGRRYRGTLILRKARGAGEWGGIHVIDEIGLEDYVNGILPLEVGSKWTMEALKAQAVASRTFALHSLNRHHAEGYDLCSKVHCQVFGGLEIEDERTNRAVTETRNEILLYKDKPAGTFFFSNCGGRTQDPVNVWGKSERLPYLKSIHCKYCKSGPHYLWKSKISGQDIAEALLSKHIFVILPLRSIRATSENIWIRHRDGEVKLRAAKFRSMVGVDLIRSTHITKIKKTSSGEFTFQGKGWGHGVGMCQEGTKGMALKGIRYTKILEFYYSGTKLKKI